MGKKETLLCLGAVNLRDFEGKRKHDEIFLLFSFKQKTKQKIAKKLLWLKKKTFENFLHFTSFSVAFTNSVSAIRTRWIFKVRFYTVLVLGPHPGYPGYVTPASPGSSWLGSCRLLPHKENLCKQLLLPCQSILSKM